MKIVSWNVNGIRSVRSKGFLPWLEQEKPEVVCLQEVKTSTDRLAEEDLNPMGYFSHWYMAEKPGYSGLALYSKKEPLSVREGLGDKAIDREARVLTIEYPELTLVNAYFPHSRRDHSRLAFKLSFCRKLNAHLNLERAKGKTVLVCGDFNIAHKEIDLCNAVSNRKNAGFLPQERSWLDRFVKSGFVDAFREFNPDPGHYTWWSNRPTVRERNVGWRLDYFFINAESRDRLRGALHRCEVRGSDHCPVLVELK